MDKKAQLTIIGAAIILLTVVTITYGFFVSGVNNDNPQTATITTGTMELTFADNDTGVAKQMIFGESIEKKFTLENTGTVDATAYLYWKDLVNTYLYGSLVYKLEYSTTANGEKTAVINNVYVPRSMTPTEKQLLPKLSVPAKGKYYYTLTITLVNSETVDQTADLNAIFTTGFNIKTGGNDLVQMYGSYLYLTDVSETTHALNVQLMSNTINDFSNVTVTKTGKNLFDLNNISVNSVTSLLTKDIQTGAFSFTKTCEASTSTSGISTDIYLPAGSYSLSIDSFETSATANNLQNISYIISSSEGTICTGNFNSSVSSKSFEIETSGLYKIWICAPYTAPNGTNISVSGLQLEMGEKTSFEPCTIQTVSANADGTVAGLTSTASIMMLRTDSSDVTINCEYQKKK